MITFLYKFPTIFGLSFESSRVRKELNLRAFFGHPTIQRYFTQYAGMSEEKLHTILYLWNY